MFLFIVGFTCVYLTLLGCFALVLYALAGIERITDGRVIFDGTETEDEGIVIFDGTKKEIR